MGYLVEFYTGGGLVMHPLLIMLLAAIYFIINRFQTFAKDGATSPGLLDEVVDLVKKGREGDALRRAEEGVGPVAASLATILRNRNMPFEDIEREVEVTGEEYFIKLEKFLPWLDTFTTLSPLLGLLGTILGMVGVFQKFQAAQRANQAGSDLLAGVGEALYATAFGIAIAITCFFFYNYFAARQRAISIETQQAATKLLAVIHDQQVSRRV
ncbi:MAG: MotA/TolQ/ExbB proton channel family protein [Capsulimonadales bacterium]|nr:MotA/TolQ/ExbB proton channel family protein [Capsulimonadales bacterium]